MEYNGFYVPKQLIIEMGVPREFKWTRTWTETANFEFHSFQWSLKRKVVENKSELKIIFAMTAFSCPIFKANNVFEKQEMIKFHVAGSEGLKEDPTEHADWDGTSKVASIMIHLGEDGTLKPGVNILLKKCNTAKLLFWRIIILPDTTYIRILILPTIKFWFCLIKDKFCSMHST